MWFPTIAKVRLQYEEFLVRVEMVDAATAQAWKGLDVDNSIFGNFPELRQLKDHCARVHGILIEAVDGLLRGSIAPRQLANRIPRLENEVRGLELIADQIRHSLDAIKAA